MATDIPDHYRQAIEEKFPDLKGRQLSLLAKGWDCLAVDADDRLIFKFPRHAEAEAGLRQEASILSYLRPRLTLPVPALTLYETPFCFTSHQKLAGAHLLSDEYAALSRDARDTMAAALAGFYAELHALPTEVMASLGAVPIKPWLPPDRIVERAAPLLDADVRDFLMTTVAAYRTLPPDPFGSVFGYFDGHGWNMAFDHAAQRLNGVYDFADSGFGSLTQDFIYSDWIATDLTDRIVDRYAALTGRDIDLERVRLLSGVLRLSEFAQYADDPENRAATYATLKAWVDR